MTHICSIISEDIWQSPEPICSAPANNASKCASASAPTKSLTIVTSSSLIREPISTQVQALQIKILILFHLLYPSIKKAGIPAFLYKHSGVVCFKLDQLYEQIHHNHCHECV